MSQRPFRFLHASDLHLERPVHGLTELPEHLRELLVEAPYRAAARMFDLAISEQAEFLLLAGDVIDVEAAGPRGPMFLVEQFDRLAAHNIKVYWAGGVADRPDLWPEVFRLPPNVHRFSAEKLEEIVHEYHEAPLVRILGQSRQKRRKLKATDFAHDDSGVYTVALGYGPIDRETLADRGLDYWALGGMHARTTLLTSPSIALYSGTHQGREPREAGPHGCTLVHVDAAGRSRAQLVPTDVVRFENERIVVNAEQHRDDLQKALNERCQQLAAAATDVEVLVQFNVFGNGHLIHELRRGMLASDLAEHLRHEHSRASPGVWTARITAEPEVTAEMELDRLDSMLDDFLRELRARAEDKEHPLDLRTYLDAQHADGELAAIAQLTEGTGRDEVLRQVAALGVDLLRPEETRL